MHVRYSTCIGLPVMAEDMEEVLGAVNGILLHPDGGKVEGFFVRVPRFLSAETLFLSSMDIAHFGRRIIVRVADVLAPPEEFFRVRSLLSDRRTMLGQRIRTEGGRLLGRCRDVQFNTETLYLEWIFPRHWWRWGNPIGITEVVEVRSEAIIVRDPPVLVKEKEAEAVQAPLLPVLPEEA